MKNIFISSTFKDMQEERDLVQERVLPALREEARKYGDNVGVIDLRWGVDTSTLETDAGSAKVLKVCLDEIDKSHPYMLIFLGERYGWIPQKSLIEAAIRGREDKFVTDDFEKSVTALEIEYGALSERYGELEHCIVCFREPLEYPLEESEKEIYIEKEKQGIDKLRKLKERICCDLGTEERLVTYSATWDESAHKLVNFQAKGKPLEEILISSYIEMFKQDWIEYEKLSWQEKEQLSFNSLIEGKKAAFVGREALLEEYYQKIISGVGQFILQGETGSGKTSIMCKLIERLQQEGKHVFAFFAGVGTRSTSAELLVKQMVYYVETLLGEEDHFDEAHDSKEEVLQYQDWMKHLQNLCAKLPEGEIVYFCIDGLEQLQKDEHVEKLDFFVQRKNIQIIASCAATFDFPIDAFSRREIQKLPALSKEDANAVAESIFAVHSRNTYEVIKSEILKKKSSKNPLYISLLIQRLNMMDADELQGAVSEEEIVELGLGIIKNMPDELEEAIVLVLENAIGKVTTHEEVLKRVLYYLAVSRNGLRMQDIQGIVSMQNMTLQVVDFTLLQKYLDLFFSESEDGRIDFTHKVIRIGLLKKCDNREAREDEIKEYIKTLDYSDPLWITEGMHFARVRNDVLFAKEIIEHAFSLEQEELAYWIINEVNEDGGAFYAGLIQSEKQEAAHLCHFFQKRILEKTNIDKGELQIKRVIATSMIEYSERMYKEYPNDDNLRRLAVSYMHMGDTLYGVESADSVIEFYQKALKCEETIALKKGDKNDVSNLITVCNRIGNAFLYAGKLSEAKTYCKKALEYAESVGEDKLELLLDTWTYMGTVLLEAGDLREALIYCEKVVKYKEALSRDGKDRLEGLASAYNNIGCVLTELGEHKNALFYILKGLECTKQLYEKTKEESFFRELDICYNNAASLYGRMGNKSEAMNYSVSALEIAKKVYEASGARDSLSRLSINYSNTGNALCNLGQYKEALANHQKSLETAHIYYEEEKSETSLKMICLAYNNMGYLHSAKGSIRDAINYYKKSLEYTQKYHEKVRSESSLELISSAYYNIGEQYRMIGEKREALRCYKKALAYAKERNEKVDCPDSQKDLCNIFNDLGSVLASLGNAREALIYISESINYAEKINDVCGDEESFGTLLFRLKNISLMEFQLKRMDNALKYCERYRQERERALAKGIPLYGPKNLIDFEEEYIQSLWELSRYLMKNGKLEEAESYSILAIEEAELLYEYTGDEKDKKLLEELKNRINM